MPRWVKRVFLKVLPKLLLMRQPSYQIKIGNYSYTYANIMEEAAKYDAMLQKSYHNLSKDSHLKPPQQQQNPTSSTLFPDMKYKHSTSSRSPEVAKAIDGINYVCEHLKKEDLEKMVNDILLFFLISYINLLKIYYF